MELLKNKILECGKVCPGNVLKVDGFLNHQVDMALLSAIGGEFARIFSQSKATKILTAEASGIIVGGMTAHAMKLPLLFAKKAQAKNIAEDVYTAQVMSYTRGKVYDIFVSAEYLKSSDRVLIIDDFLASGEALKGLIDLVKQANATLVGCGTVIEKGFQGGGDSLRAQGIRVESLAVVESMSENGLVFAP